jgi:hypothetical protein
MGAWNPSTMQTCHPPPTTSTCKQSQVMVSGQNYVKYDCSIEETPAQWPGINTTFVLVAIAGVALLFFMRK